MSFPVLPTARFVIVSDIPAEQFHQLQNEQFNFAPPLLKPYQNAPKGTYEKPTISYIWDQDHFEIIKTVYSKSFTELYNLYGHGRFVREGGRQIIVVHYSMDFVLLKAFMLICWLLSFLLLAGNLIKLYPFTGSTGSYIWMAVSGLLPFMIRAVFRAQYEILHRQLCSAIN